MHAITCAKAGGMLAGMSLEKLIAKSFEKPAAAEPKPLNGRARYL
jgi:hypothetical protein